MYLSQVSVMAPHPGVAGLLHLDPAFLEPPESPPEAEVAALVARVEEGQVIAQGTPQVRP